MGFLGGGVFGAVGTDFDVVFAVGFFDITGGAGHSLLRQVYAVGSHVGYLTFLVELLGGLHGRFGAKPEARVGGLL